LNGPSLVTQDGRKERGESTNGDKKEKTTALTFRKYKKKKGRGAARGAKTVEEGEKTSTIG